MEGEGSLELNQQAQATQGDGDTRQRQDGSASSGNSGMGLVERVSKRERIGYLIVRERMGCETKKKGVESDLV